MNKSHPMEQALLDTAPRLDSSRRRRIARLVLLIYLIPHLLGIAPPTTPCFGQSLPGTQPLTMEGDITFEMLAGVDRFLLKETERSVERRRQHWARDYSSPAAHMKSVEPNRQRLRHFIGLVDERAPFEELELISNLSASALVAETPAFRVLAVRWPVFDRVYAEGLLLDPKGTPSARIVALPDADQTPEMIAGVSTIPAPGSAFARRLAHAGAQVLIPTLLDRDNTWAGNPKVRMTNQSHREWVYRQAYYVGRHVIGYEVQKVLAAVDYFSAQNQRTGSDLRIGVAGYGEGGLIALHSGAADPRIDVTWVSGHFQPREQVWQEPLYRNVWGLLTEFGDAEIASLIAPRPLIIEASKGPEVAGPPPPRNDRDDAATGSLTTPSLASVAKEFQRVQRHYERLGAADKIRLVAAGSNGEGSPGSHKALMELLSALNTPASLKEDATAPLGDKRGSFDATLRMKRQYDELVDFTHQLMLRSPYERASFWTDADGSSPERWKETTRKHRQYFRDEIIGHMPGGDVPANPRTRRIYETPKWTGYEVVLDVYEDVFAYGIILVPKDLRPGEQRPVVVAQHGRGGRPQVVADPESDHNFYHAFGARLADRGFIVYAPQNLFIGEEKYRTLERKGNPLKMTFFAPMVSQHEQLLNWLSSLSYVDPKRIAFYGLSYGGKSALWIPAVLERYAASISSGAFTETVWKHIDINSPKAFIFTKEHEHTEFGIANKFNHSDIAGLIAPRPFMVERGHRDGGFPDEWVAHEYARVRRLYVLMGIGDQTDAEFFDGGHEIHQQGTYRFLHRHLNWPEPGN